MSEKKKITYVSLTRDENIHEEYKLALTKIESELGQHHAMFIGKQNVFSTNEFMVQSPIDRDIVIGFFQKANEAHARLAVNEAKKSFYDWSQTNWKDRTRIIQMTAGVLDQEKFPLSALITFEAGKNRFEALAEVEESTL